LPNGKEDTMSTIALIPVRGGSKSIPGKNIKLLRGKPLLHWTLGAALAARRIDQVVVSSDSDDILRCAAELAHPKLRLSKRAPELAQDQTSTEAVMLDFAERERFDRLVLIQATSPFTKTSDFDEALGLFERQNADSLLTVTHEHRFRWVAGADGFVTATNYDPARRPRRQDWAGELVENGAFYVCTRTGLIASGSRLHGRICHYVMEAHSAIEIDNPADWEIIEALAARHAPSRDGAAPDIRLLITDVDGVLTDGGMYYGADGEALKKFDTRDGMGVQLWRESGRELAIVTGENSPAVAQRARKLQISELHLGISDKLTVVRALAAARSIDLSAVAYLGDDINDLEAMRAIGISACPADAQASVLAVANYVCKRAGGAGCLREFIEHLLRTTPPRAAPVGPPLG
jgi:YrbI family 3-deoxy-D-manno-octulosonate 8-phosphate phosphatase